MHGRIESSDAEWRPDRAACFPNFDPFGWSKIHSNQERAFLITSYGLCPKVSTSSPVKIDSKGSPLDGSGRGRIGGRATPARNLSDAKPNRSELAT